MYTSLVFVALTGSVIASSHDEGLNWQSDYTQAKNLGQTTKKPLAVVIGSGAGGHVKVCQEGKFTPELMKSLMDNYVCMYVDVATPAGKALAIDFNNTRGVGLILSDRTGNLQAFTHDGDLSPADLSKWITYAADPNLTVSTTMNNTSSRTSMYPSYNSNGFSNSGQMIYNTGSYGMGNMFMGGGCPGGNCGGGFIREQPLQPKKS